MANATEEDFDLHVAGSGIAAGNGGEGQWRRLVGGRIVFGLVHGALVLLVMREAPSSSLPRLKSNALIEVLGTVLRDYGGKVRRPRQDRV